MEACLPHEEHFQVQVLHILAPEEAEALVVAMEEPRNFHVEARRAEIVAGTHLEVVATAADRREKFQEEARLVVDQLEDLLVEQSKMVEPYRMMQMGDLGVEVQLGVRLNQKGPA